jgi:hypothetical protein
MGVDAHRRAPVKWGVTPIGAGWNVTHDAPMTPISLRKRPRWRARLRTAWRAAELDEALADGEDPLKTEELALRACQLVKPAKRAELARSVEVIVKQVAAGGPSPVPGPTILRREPVARNRRGLQALARRLRDEGMHCLPGLAMADRLIRFGDSPLYMALDPLQLTHRIEEVLAAFEPDWDGQPADMPRGDGE